MTAIFFQAANVWTSFSNTFRPVEMPSSCSCRKFQVILHYAALGGTILSVIGAIVAAILKAPLYVAIFVGTTGLSFLGAYHLRQILMAPPPPPPPLLSTAIEKKVTEDLVQKHRHESPQPDIELYARIQDHVRLQLLPSSLSPEKRAELLKDYKKDTLVFTPQQVKILEADLDQQDKQTESDEVEMTRLFGPDILKEPEGVPVVQEQKKTPEKQIPVPAYKPPKVIVEEVRLNYRQEKPVPDPEVVKEVQEEVKKHFRPIEETPVQPPRTFTQKEIQDLEKDLLQQALECDEDESFLDDF